MGKRPFKQDHIGEATGKPYHEWLDGEIIIEWEELNSFLQSIDVNSNHVRAVKRVFDKMSDDTSDIRNYMVTKGHEEFQKKCHLGMDMFKLKEVLKQFQIDTGDKSNGWYDNPANFLLFYQMWTLANVKVWREDGESSSVNTSKRPKPRTVKEKVDPDSHCVVYAIINLNERNAFGNYKCYIGRTTAFSRRMKQHQQSKSGCRLIRDAIQKYGLYGNGESQPMIHRVLVSGKLEDMKWCETHYIEAYNSFAPNGYNLRAGDTAGMDNVSSSKLVPSDRMFDITDFTPKMQLVIHNQVVQDIGQIIDSNEGEQLFLE